MFDIGFSEMVLLAIIALIAVGPKQLPEVARKAARFINDAKRIASEFTGQLTDARENANRLFTETQEDLLKSLSDEKPSEPSPDAVASPQPAAEAMPINKLEKVIPPESNEPLPEPDPGANLPPHTPFDGLSAPEQMTLGLESAVTSTKPAKGSDE